MERPCQPPRSRTQGDASAFSTGMAHPLKFEARRAEATLEVCCSLDAVLLGHCTRAERLSVARLGCWYAGMARRRAHRHRLRLAFEAVGPLDSAQGSRNGKGPGRCLALTARTSRRAPGVVVKPYTGFKLKAPVCRPCGNAPCGTRTRPTGLKVRSRLCQLVTARCVEIQICGGFALLDGLLVTSRDIGLWRVG